MEAMQPAPDGLRVEGYEANVAFWEAMIADPNGSFEVEDVVISGDRATNRWYIVMIDATGGGDSSNRILLAVSAGPTITSTMPSACCMKRCAAVTR